MSSPFPLEEASQTDSAEPVWNPWKESRPAWYSGFGFNEETAYTGPIYRALEIAGNAAAKGEAVMGGVFGLAGRVYNSVGTPRAVGQELEPIGAAITQDARERVKATTPDPATTGTAAQLLNTLGSGAIRFAVGTALGGPAGAAAAVGSTESVNRYQELREAGVDQGTAGESAGLAGVAGAAGAFIPGGFGSTLLTRIASGASANTAFGITDRYLDHKILENGGYSEMAEQQKALDATQLIVDAALGATFGLIHHAASPNLQDAALTANLALRDRQSAPGVATDPHAANAHQAALEKAQEDLLSGKPVDVSGTDVDEARFLSRPTRDLTPENEIILKSFKESGLLDEEANLRDLEEQFAQRRSGEPETPRNASTFIDEFETRNPQSPEEPAERLVNGNVRVGITADPIDSDTAHIESVRALQTGTGSGTDAMQHIADLADEHGVRLTLHADPLDVDGIGSRKLVEWYKRFGFRITHNVGEGALMERPPGGAPEAALLPEPEELESVGAEHSLDNAYAVALTARAAQLEPDLVWKLAEKHASDTEGFIREVQSIVDQHETTRSGGGEGSAAHAAEAGRQSGEQPARGESTPAAGTTGHLATQALIDRPDLTITDEHGQPIRAADALKSTQSEDDWFTATKAAADCFSRRGG